MNKNSLYAFLVIIFILATFSPLYAGQGVSKPGRTDEGLKSFLKNDVDTMGDAQTYYRGENIGLSQTELTFLISNQGHLTPPNFFDSVSYENNGYAGQHVRVGQKIYIHERLSASGNPSDKFGSWGMDGYTQLSNSNSQFCDEGSYAVNSSQEEILWIVGACGTLNNTELYDIDTDNWYDTVAQFPSSVKAGSSEDFGMVGRMPTVELNGTNYSYYFGGFEASGNGDKAFRYNWNNDSWESISDLPDTWDKATASRVYETTSGDSVIFLTAGEINGNSPTQQFWSYNIQNDAYTQRKEIPTESKSNGGVFLPVSGNIAGSNIYFLSGRPTGEGSDSLSVYDVDSNSWSTYRTGATGGFVGLGMKQPSATMFNMVQKENIKIMNFLVSSTTHADHIGYKFLPVQIYPD